MDGLSGAAARSHRQNHSSAAGHDVASGKHAFARRALRGLVRLNVAALVGAQTRRRALHNWIRAGADGDDRAGDLITETRPLGLSLADRACLALGLDLKVPVYTADRSWKNLKVGVRIHVIR